MGAMPAALACGGYILQVTYDWHENLLVQGLVLCAWLVAPVPLKWIGLDVWRWASPSCKAMAPVLWVFWVEFAFALLGIQMFMTSTMSAVSYSLSLVFPLIYQATRGTE